MDQAAWNLCPVSGVSSGTSCYYANDQTFTDLTGTLTVTIDDCPDGEACLHSFFAPVCFRSPAMPCNTDYLLSCATYPFSFVRHLLTTCSGKAISFVIGHKHGALANLSTDTSTCRQHYIAMHVLMSMQQIGDNSLLL